jgi:hypothetical protein
MKITRKTLLFCTAALGSFLILYGLIRFFLGIGFDEAVEKRMIDVIIISALGLFLYNRKLARDEQKAKEESARAEEEAEAESADSKVKIIEETNDDDDNDVDENLPHWERDRAPLS